MPRAQIRFWELAARDHRIDLCLRMRVETDTDKM